MHQLKQINFSQPQNIHSEVFVYEDVTDFGKRFAPKVTYQRSVVKQIVSALLGAKITIEHKESGAPFIVEFPEKNISISHSQDYYAIQLSGKKKVGVDIQVFKKNLEKGKDYFVNEWETKNLDLTELNLHLIWSAKEVAFKLLQGEIEKYKEGITIVSFSKSKLRIKINKLEFYVRYKTNDSFVLVYKPNYEKY